jgi:hypothetical protein
MSNTLRSILPATFYEKVQNQHSFVLNVLASWCSDCTEQQINIQAFSNLMVENQLEVLQLTAQKEKGVYIDADHQALIEQLGGHGYPRTVLVLKGQIVSSDNVEVISENDLTKLANTFKNLL